MTPTPTLENEEDMLVAPPAWADVEADEEFQQLTPVKKQKVLSTWSTLFRDYTTKTGQFDDATREQFSQFVTGIANSYADDWKKSVEDPAWLAIPKRGIVGLGQGVRTSQAFLARLTEGVTSIPVLGTAALDAVGANKLLPEELQDKGLTGIYREAVPGEFQRQADYYEAEAQKLGETGQYLGGGMAGEIAQGVGGAAPQMALDVGAALATGGSSAAVPIAKQTIAALRPLYVSAISAGLQSTASTLSEAEDRLMEANPTLTRDEARLQAAPEALTSGAITGLVTRLGGYTGVESILRKEGPKVLKARVLGVLKESLVNEPLEEMTDQALQDLRERFYSNPNKAWADTYYELAVTYGVAAVLGGVATGGNETLVALAQRADRAEQNNAPRTAEELRKEVVDDVAAKTAEVFGGDPESDIPRAEEILREREEAEGIDDESGATEQQPAAAPTVVAPQGVPAPKEVSPTGDVPTPTTPEGITSGEPTPAPQPLSPRAKMGFRVLVRAGVDEETAARVSAEVDKNSPDEDLTTEAWRERVLTEFEDGGGIRPGTRNYSEDPAYYALAFNVDETEAQRMAEDAKAANTTYAEEEIAANKAWTYGKNRQSPGEAQAQPGTSETSPQTEGGANPTRGESLNRAPQSGGLPESSTESRFVIGRGTAPIFQGGSDRLPRTPRAALEVTPEQEPAPQPIAVPKAEPDPSVGLGFRSKGDTEGRGIISKKVLPARIVKDESGVERTEPVFVNDPDTLAEMLHAIQGSQRIYIPDDVIDNEELDENQVGFAFEAGTGHAYVTSAQHSRYPENPIQADGTISNPPPGGRVTTLEDLYQTDPERTKNSDAQTKGRDFELPEETTEFVEKVESAPISQKEQENPGSIANGLEGISRIAELVAQETYLDNRGNSTPIGPVVGERIAAVARTIYLGRLRGVVSGNNATPYGAVQDAKAKFIDRLSRREGVGSSLDASIGSESDGMTLGDQVSTGLFGDSPVQTQAQETEGGAAQGIDSDLASGDEQNDFRSRMAEALKQAAAELTPEEAAIWKEATERLTKKDSASRWRKITQEQQPVVERVRARAAELLAESVDDSDRLDDEGTTFTKPGSVAVPETDAKLRARKQKNLTELLSYQGMGGENWDVPRMLDSIAQDKNQSPFLRLIARTLLNSKHDFSKVGFELASQPRANWAARYHTAPDGRIEINLAVNHANSVASTIVHEAWHHVMYFKLRSGFKRNAVEEAAYRDLTRIFRHIRRQAAGDFRAPGETTGSAATRLSSENREFYGISNLDEMVSEALSNPNFAAWLATQAPIEGLSSTGRGIRNLLQAIKHILKRLVLGVPVRSNSLLDQAMERMFALSEQPVREQDVNQFLQSGQGPTNGPANSAPAGDSLAARADAAGRALMDLAGEKGEALFSFPATLSPSTDLREVLNSTGEEFTTIQASGGTWVSPTSERQVGDPVVFSKPNGDSFGAGSLRSIGDAESVINRFDNDQDITLPNSEFVDHKHTIFLSESAPGDWVIDSSAGFSGNLRMASQAYQAIYHWAKNNGFRIVPDTSTSWAGNYRRNAHQLSSALREGSAEHFEPTTEQLAEMFPQTAETERLAEWSAATTEEKIASLMRAETSYVEQAVPGLVKFEYDFGSDTIREAGNPLNNREQFGRRLREEVQTAQGSAGLSQPDRVGIRTALRYLAEKALLRGDTGRSTSPDSDRGSLNRIFYAAPTGGQGSHPNAGRVDEVVQTSRASTNIQYVAQQLGDHPAHTSVVDGQLVIAYDPDVIARDVEGLSDEDAAEAIRALLHHEEVHAAGFLSDYTTPDAQGRVGQAKLEAFHDEVMTEEMRQDTVDGYLTQLEGETDEAFAKRREALAADKVQVAAEFKRRFAERYLTGEAQEDVLDRLEARTGNKFLDTLQGVWDYLAARVRWLRARWEATKNPRIGAEIRLDLRNMRLLSDRSGKTLEQLQFEEDLRQQHAALAARAEAEGFASTEEAILAGRAEEWMREWRATHPYDFKDGISRDQNPEEVDIRLASSRKRKNENVGGWKASGWLGQGLMDLRVFDRLMARDADIRAASYRVQELAKKFNRLVKEHKPEAIVLRDALGTTDNKLTDAQLEEIKRLKRVESPEVAEAFKLTALQENIQAAKARRAAALAKLPLDLKEVVNTMRGDIDRLSQTLISSNVISGPLQATIGDNLEVYLNRSFEIFDNPDYAEFIRTDMSPESVAIRNNATNLFRSELIAEKAKEIRREARLAGKPVPTRKDALVMAAALVTPEEVQNRFDEYLLVADENSSTVLLGGRLPGKKNTSIITMRGQLPAELRALWGEYKDPEVNYAKSYMKLTRFIAEHNFQTDLLNLGLNSAAPFLWKRGVSKTPTHPQGWVEIYPNLGDSPHPNPMAGVYGPRIMADAFRDTQTVYKQWPTTKLIHALTGWAMASKTVYNIPQSNVRNFLGNGLIMMANGYLRADRKTIGHMATALRAAGQEAVLTRPERTQAATDYIERMIRLGVAEDNVKASVIQELTRDVWSTNPEKAFGEAAGKVFNFVRNEVHGRATAAYQAGDTIWKIYAFESELDTIRKAFPNATPEEQDRMAADRVVSVVPTYSRIPKVVKDLVKKQSVFSPFISWTSEIIRVSFNAVRLAINDVKSGNDVLRASGLKRLTWFTVANATLSALAVAVRNASGVTDEEEEALRRFLPPWQVNALLMITGKKGGGKVGFWDLSYLNPYNVIHEPFTAGVRELNESGDIVSASVAAAAQAMEPWTSEQLLAGAFIDVLRGVDANGRPIVNPADSTWNKTRDRVLRVADSLKPGTANIATRIWHATQGTVIGGRSYDLGNELLGPVIGQRLSEADPLNSMKMGKIPAFERLKSDAQRLATSALKRNGTPDLGQIRENYFQANDSMFEAYREMRKDVDALRTLGVPDAEIFKVLKGGNVTQKTISQIMSGVYVRYEPTDAAFEVAYGTPQAPARIQAMRQAIKDYPAVQRLTDD